MQVCIHAEQKTCTSLLSGAGVLSAIAGRLLCDTYLAARDLVKEVDYTLTTLSHNLLKQARTELAAADIPGVFYLSPPLPVLLINPSDFLHGILGPVLGRNPRIAELHACQGNVLKEAEVQKRRRVLPGGICCRKHDYE